MKMDLRAIGFDRGQIGYDDAVSKVQLQVDVQPLHEEVTHPTRVAQRRARRRAPAAGVTQVSLPFPLSH